jgi:hypothetical protein
LCCRWDDRKCAADLPLFAVHENQLSVKDVKDNIFVPPFLTSSEELWAWISEVVATTDESTIHRI